MRIRQVVLVAKELGPVVDDLCAVLGTGVGFNDPDVGFFGLKNAVLPVGDQFVEVVCPVRDDATAKRYLDRRKGDGGYMLILQTDDLDRDLARLGGLGVRFVWSGDFPEIRGRHLHPKDTGGTLLSLDQPVPPESWKWAGPRWKEVRQTGAVTRIPAVELQSEDPEALAGRWAEVLDCPVRKEGDGFVIEIGADRIRFVPATDGRGEGLSAFDLEGPDPARVLAAARARGLPVEDRELVLGGVRFRLV